MRRPRRTAAGLLLFSLTLPSTACSGGAAAPPDIERGKQVYRAQRCAVCHSIEGSGNRRNPLDGVGSKLSTDDIRKWIVSPKEMQPDIRKKSYDLPPDDLTALIAYIESLKN